MTVFLTEEKAMAPTPVLLPGKSHGRRSLVGCIPSGRYKLDMTERLHFHFSLSLSHIGEGNGNPLQCSCLENPREPGGLPSMGSHRVGHDWSDLAAVAAEHERWRILTFTSYYVPAVVARCFVFPYLISQQVSERDGREFQFIDKEPKAKLSNFISWSHN